MNKRSNENIDGFVLKRRGAKALERPQGLGAGSLKVPEKFLDRSGSKPADDSQLPGIDPAEEAALKDAGSALSEGEQEPKKRSLLKRLFRRGKKEEGLDRGQLTAKYKRKRLIKRVLIALGSLLLLVGIILGIKAFLASQNIFDGNLFGLFSEKRLQTDQNGRTNILVFGTEEDSPYHDDAGGELTDSIMILSIHQDEKDAFMLSLPRDLWVKYERSCPSGFEGKLNAAYMCGKSDNNNEQEGTKFLQKVVEDHFGVSIQYQVKVGFKALVEAVDAVGGVTVEIESDDPRGVLDRNFDWECNYQCYYVNYPNGPAELDGKRALALARARNAAGGYGLSGGNFDREQYQQKIIVALKEKAISTGTLANPVAVSRLIDSLGNNVRTNFDTAEIRTLVRLADEIKTDSIQSLSLLDEDEPMVTTGSYMGQSIVQPIAGVYDFSQIQSYLKKHFTNDPTVREGATIDVLNGSGIAGAAGRQADKITDAGLAVGVVGNAPSGNYGYARIYDLSEGKKPATLAKLEQLFGATATTNSLPSGVQSTADFVIIVGTDGAN
jgi:polyisoprenyl-teichoic acid--peptidoglycan teichoic acid transferase